MILSISGEPYQAYAFRKQQRERYKEGYEYYFFDAVPSADTLANASNLLLASSLFRRPKYIEIKGAGDQMIKTFLKEKRDEGEHIIVFFSPGEKASKIKNKKLTIHHFELLQGAALQTFIAQECTMRKAHLPPAVAQSLFALVAKGGTLYPAMNEIEKISLAPRHAQALLFQERQENPFALTDAMSKKNIADALQLLEREFLENKKPIEVLNRMLWQLRVLLMVSHYPPQTTRYKLNFHPFVIKKARQALGFFSLSEVKLLYLEATLLYERLLFSGLPSQLLLSQFFWKMKTSA